MEYSQAGHMCHEHLTDVINSSIHTEQGSCPRGKAGLTAGLAGLIVQPGCGMLLCHLCKAVIVLLIYSVKLIVNSSSLHLAHLLPSARLCVEHGVKGV